MRDNQRNIWILACAFDILGAQFSFYPQSDWLIVFDFIILLKQSETKLFYL